MELDEYQRLARHTAIYPSQRTPTYPALKLAGEAGEVAEHVGKAIRDDVGVITPERHEDLKSELGDVLWYIANLAEDLDMSLEDIARSNVGKLQDRRDRGVIGGSGSNR